MTENPSLIPPLPSPTSRVAGWLTWPAAIFIAYVFLSNEQYKILANPQAVWLFTLLTDWMHLHGHEQAFRLFTAACEVTAAILVLIPRTRLYGAVLTLCVISGAIFFHLFSPLGTDPAHDGGKLFHTACATWLAAGFIIAARQQELFKLLKRLRGL